MNTVAMPYDTFLDESPSIDYLEHFLEVAGSGMERLWTMENETKAETWSSRRLLLQKDGMGFSYSKTIIYAGTETHDENGVYPLLDQFHGMEE